MSTNKLKVINDPVYGLINIENELVFDVIEHRLFQRLRRIKQLGFSYLVYPGAMHTRFQHSLGAAFLMQNALKVISDKGCPLTSQDKEAALLAILLHDLGHGPFSHTLENSFFDNISHEEISAEFMKIINNDFNGAIQHGISVFTNEHHKKILHKLVSSQLDMDRLDYLNRDSFFTGVSEGVIGSERIIKMLNFVDNEPVVEAKGIYSVEKFLIARRLMYWQVYLHKTVVVAEEILKLIIKRAKEIIRDGKDIFAPPSLKFFLKNSISKEDLHKDFEGKTPLDFFAQLDDSDIISSIKVWQFSDDFVLSNLCNRLINRKLFKIEIFPNECPDDKFMEIRKNVLQKQICPKQYIDYFVIRGTLYNKAYSRGKDETIKIVMKDGLVKDIASASDISNVSALSKTVKKSFICYAI
ncbi:MAG: HD domain-containing protein [Bacteroidales bacterium]|nr:HD domain-containing protein [Bacteroidales bacterium]